MPFVLESAAYNIGYVIGQVIGVAIFLAILAGIAYLIYRATRKKRETTISPPVNSAQDAAQAQGRPCPNCRSYAQPEEVYCRNCGQQLQPIP